MPQWMAVMGFPDFPKMNLNIRYRINEIGDEFVCKSLLMKTVADKYVCDIFYKTA